MFYFQPVGAFSLHDDVFFCCAEAFQFDVVQLAFADFIACSLGVISKTFIKARIW